MPVSVNSDNVNRGPIRPHLIISLQALLSKEGQVEYGRNTEKPGMVRIVEDSLLQSGGPD